MKKTLVVLASSLGLSAIASATTVAHWQFNDLTDSSGNGHNLTDTNTGATISGGKANFTNTSVTGLLSAADSSAWDDTSFTVEAIVNVTSTSTLTGIAAHMTSNAPGRQWFFGTSDTGVPLFIINPSSGTEASFTSSFSALTSGNTYYIAASINLNAVNAADRITFYLRDITADGAFQTSNVSTNFTGFADSTSLLTIGSTGHSSSRLAGSIDEIRISDTNLGPNDLLIQPIPEPSHVMLSGLGIALLGIRRRRA